MMDIRRRFRLSLAAACILSAFTPGISSGQSTTLDDLLRGLREDQPAPDTSSEPAEPVVPEFLRESEPAQPASPPQKATAKPTATPKAAQTPATPTTTPKPEARESSPAAAPKTPPADNSLPEYAEGEVNPFLMSNLNEVLRGRAPDSVRVNLTFPGASELLTQEQVTLGAAIVQGLGLRTDLKPLLITYGPRLVPGRFNVLIGTKTELASILSPDLSQEIGESGMCLVPMPGYQEEPVLVITGTTQKGIHESVLALGFVNMDLPAAQFLSIRRVLFPETPPYFGQPPVNPGDTYTFAQLQQIGAPIRPVRTGGIGLQIFFPADIFDRPSAKVNMMVHFSVGQNTRRSSDALVVRLNGSEVLRTPWGETIPSDNEGRFVTFSLPIGKFQSGRNLLELTTDSGGSSQFSLSPRGLPANDLLIFTDSSIEIPNVPRGARLPDLKLTSRTLYPFVGQPDGSEISFLLTDNRSETVCAAWMLIAKLSQTSNTFLYGSEVSFTYANPDRHLIVIGAQSRIPTTLRERIPEASFSELGSSKNEEEIEYSEEEREPTAIERFFSGIRDEFKKIEVNQPTDEDGDGVLSPEERSSSRTPIGSRAVMTSFPSPETDSRWILVVTARTDELLLDRVRELVTVPFWSQIDGYLFSWNDTPSSVRAFLPDKSFREVSFRETIVPIPWGYGVSLRIWYIFSALVFLAFILMTLLVLKHMDRTIAQRRKE
ncbi:cellulose biosynthesis cyclic di-GMP-binding regulatory protein BcsB [Puniceicoccus vermicola]|uniref:Cellulose biosynthesis cyclic di-GMP-binding regulatory protein BcsB n=1 Tax=Puniceicoccus vermicola TaxID=388746 RepID=A0A7X1AWI9_9BACT|nr:cellulose biosynthesis cyclic di-GMP-binding regulatory protein BcsB [Puniceicoccus vermicola]MBC2601301.1 cellulose biosynthesis cyclic di-GMP-binding regulatory protein BcsB [Puniceicoccus vermicola]